MRVPLNNQQSKITSGVTEGRSQRKDLDFSESKAELFIGSKNDAT